MKILSKIALICILGGIVFLTTTCTKQKFFSYVNYEGFVYDSLGGKEVQGVQVVLNACTTKRSSDNCSSFEVGKSTTDGSGHFKIHEKAARYGRYQVYVNGQSLHFFNYTTSESDLSKNSYKIIYLK